MSSNTGSLDGSESHSRPELATPSVSIAEINHGDELTSSNSVILSLLKPTAMESNGLGQKDELLKVHTSKTYVNQLKSHISTTWPGKPKIDGIRLIARGRILDDSEIVGAALCSSVSLFLPLFFLLCSISFHVTPCQTPAVTTF